MWQAVDDSVGRASAPLTLAAGKARRRTDPAGRGAGLALDAAVWLGAAPARLSRAGRSVAQWRATVMELAVHAAVLAVRSTESGRAMTERADAEKVAALLARLGPPPETVRAAVTRIPSCFRAFDQHPDDVAALIDRFAGRRPRRSRPVVVVGVRTSGSYLAPFAVAHLRRAGYTDATMVSARPDQRYTHADAQQLREAAGNRAVALVIDDPPASGSAVARVCAGLAEFGFSRESTIPVLALFGESSTPPGELAEFDAVTLPWPQWSIHRRLAPQRTATDLSAVFAPATVEVTGELPAPAALPRTHARRLYRVRIGHENGRHETRAVLASGSGLGYFGDYDVGVACALKERVPAVLARTDGVVYLDWPVDPRPALPTTGQVTDYIAARHDNLPVADDRSDRLRGCQPAWEVASNHVARVYGRYWPLARIAFVDRLTRRLLATASPSVPDGDMRPGTWLAGCDGDLPVKTSFADRTFSNFDLVCFDDRFDVVGAAVHTSDPGYARELRAAYESRTDRAVGPERWLLYELVHLWDLQRLGSASPAATRVRKSQAVRRYLAEVLLPDLDRLLPDRDRGPVVALDVDGVLETDLLGFKAPTPTAVLSLRALHAHGYRTVLATGRSLEEVVDLTTTFGLAGGAAEYGAVTYHRPTHRVDSRIDAAQKAALDRLRACLRDTPGVQLDDRHRHSVRASALDRGRLGPYTPAAGVLPPGVKAVRGQEQTDFIAVGTDKADAVRALLRDLGEGAPALAVGDTAADATFLALARLSVAPRHADAAARSAARHTAPGPYQAGLAHAVSRLIGHRPGGCPRCAPPPLTADTEAMLRLLRIPEHTRLHALYRTLPLLRSGAPAGRRAASASGR